VNNLLHGEYFHSVVAVLFKHNQNAIVFQKGHPHGTQQKSLYKELDFAFYMGPSI
jgi:hypothetical protein